MSLTNWFRGRAISFAASPVLFSFRGHQYKVTHPPPIPMCCIAAMEENGREIMEREREGVALQDTTSVGNKGQRMVAYGRGSSC